MAAGGMPFETYGVTIEGRSRAKRGNPATTRPDGRKPLKGWFDRMKREDTLNEKVKRPGGIRDGRVLGFFLGRMKRYWSLYIDKERCGMEAKDNEVKETYTVQEVARLLKCSDQTVRKLLKGNDLRGAKVGRGWRITYDEVVRLTRLQG